MLTKFKTKTNRVYNKLVEDIKTGELIEINGKQYRKIKIAFVDSMNYSVSNHVENLETEIHSLNQQLFKANSEIQKLLSQQLAQNNYYKYMLNEETKKVKVNIENIEKLKSENEIINKRNSIIAILR